jgi:L-threonylcarbamoyladenylate synthase
MKQKTQLLKAHKKEDIATALALLRRGELVAVPTETVYGLAADAKNSDAVKKIFVAKGRPSDHPLIVHIASFKNLTEWAKDVSPLAGILAKKFWPGPLTLLLNKAETVSDVVTGGLKTVALRVPKHPILLELLNELHTGLAAPSANPHKRISPTTAAHVMAGLSGKIAAVLDAGPCEFGLESTIVDLTGPTPRILRPGPITQKMIEDALQISMQASPLHSEKVAGNMSIHYQPYTQTLLMPLEEIEEYLSLPIHQDKLFALMHYSPLKVKTKNVILQQMPAHKEAYAKVLYKTLHDLDGMKVDQILIEMPPQDAQWSDILDRLSKAAAKL